VNVTAANSTFRSNKASYGGVFDLHCDEDNIDLGVVCNYTMQNCSMVANTVSVEGGAIKYNLYPPAIDNEESIF